VAVRGKERLGSKRTLKGIWGEGQKRSLVNSSKVEGKLIWQRPKKGDEGIKRGTAIWKKGIHDWGNLYSIIVKQKEEVDSSLSATVSSYG